ncbi:hypothetical protein K737_300376 [Holospora undulata HU1]|uniref:Transposase n=1 Tax=Holospora undulata HU1 TaxID=1321371 RepID=A0A061JI26_9PROT|nr:hypothetical protein K737_300376 [Holospora undulata HU1]
MNIKIALKAVLFEGESGTNVKNVEKFSRGMPEKYKLQALVLYASGLSMNRIAQRFGVSATAVLKGGHLRIRICTKVDPSPEDKGIVKEVDEFWNYLKKEAKIWIFKAWISKVYDRAGKGLFDWEFGDRLSQTFKRLFERLLFYCADHWAEFNKIIPSTRLFQGKDKRFPLNKITLHIAIGLQDLSPLANTRSLEILEVTLHIFAELHTNKILKIHHAIFS